MSEKGTFRRLGSKQPGADRSARLEAQLKANLKKRKEQARARRNAGRSRPSEQDESGK